MNDLRKNADAPPAPERRPPDGRDRDSRNGAVSYLEIDEQSEGQRLDNLLIRVLKGVPRSHLYQLVRSGQVRVNGGRAQVLQRLKLGDRVRIPPVRAASTPVAATAPAEEFPIVHEDEQLLVIDKPAGVAVHGGSGVSSGVIERLRSARPTQKFLELVHRIDRDTSGLLMLAKKRTCLVRLQDQFRDRALKKTYLAIVLGHWPRRTRTLKQSLEPYRTREGERRVAVSEGGQVATTHVLGLSNFALPTGQEASLVECRIETGRMHQIRVHLAFAGYPVIGDQKYGDFELNKSLYKLSHKRMYLHAYSLEVRHPDDQTLLRLDAVKPAEFDRLEQSGNTAALA